MPTEFELWLEKKNKRTKKGPAHRAGKKSSSFEVKEPKTALKRRVVKVITPEEKKEKIKAKREKQAARVRKPKKPTSDGILSSRIRVSVILLRAWQ